MPAWLPAWPFSIEWAPQLGIALDFYVDGLAARVLATGRTVFVDVGIGLALVGFLFVTLILAYLLLCASAGWRFLSGADLTRLTPPGRLHRDAAAVRRRGW